MSFTVRITGSKVDAGQASISAIEEVLAEVAGVPVKVEVLAEEVQAPPHSGTHPILRWFEYAHLPIYLQSVSAAFGVVARDIIAHTKGGAEQTVALRKLLEAKDAAVRAAIEKHATEKYNAEVATRV